ncbi:PPK2 family polyphosphate kinase [Paenibacillus sp. CAA11]|uniref:PPK2 family polyphosphate kinase n=1 Tax=Paenibacillus sp. CAA11 TaxID=1532905 RepID=UPI001F2631D5|nr:PPK2 family polyphosphate kinase [Paenibacillus sp. CAA11]
MDLEKYKVHSSPFTLRTADPSDTGHFHVKDDAEEKIKSLKERLSDLQNILFADKRHALLVILQGMDTSGKDGTIKHLFAGINPQGFHVYSFKKPTEEERSRDFLWRVHQQVPAKGYITAFNRSHYEDVLVPQVHGTLSDEELKQRLQQIRHFEELLAAEGTRIVKLFLHISKDKQREKIRERLEQPKKFWKFDPADLAEREYWDAYQSAYEHTLTATSSEHAPWYWIPAHHKWYRDYVVLQILVHELESLKLKYPELKAAPEEISRYLDQLK